MLIEYSIENFRSISETKKFSLLPAKGSSKPGNLLTIEDNKNIKKLLKSCVIYGANASGKTNVIYALHIIRDLVLNSKNYNVGDEVNGYFPFALDSKYSNKPTKFMIHFIKDHIEYKYGFSYTSEKIISEELLYYKGKKERYFFKRNLDKIEPSEDMEELTNLFRNTGDNVLFLSKANNEYKKFKPVFEWFSKNISIFGTAMGPLFPLLSPEFTISYMNSSPENKQKVLKLLHYADFNISDIKGKTVPVGNKPLEDFKTYILSMVIDAQDKIDTIEKKISPTVLKERLNKPVSYSPSLFELMSVRETSDGKTIIKDFVPFESAGTTQFFNIIGLWLEALQDENKVIVIDEFDTRLHPDLQIYLIQLFHDPEINRKNSQLIITSHNTRLLALDIFRREQILFTEKNTESQSTEFFSLYDYEKRQDRSVEKNYFFGRYGALPDITYGEI
jgi:hypothetical protein